MRILVTGGAGFIGSHVIKKLLQNKENVVFNLDKMGYASSTYMLDKLINENSSISSNQYKFLNIDLSSKPETEKAIEEARPNLIMHLAAESHVDRSIDGPEEFIKSNIVGTFNLLESARNFWSRLNSDEKDNFRFHHISTDEVFGSLGDSGSFSEETPYDPRSPYSASKASSDHLVRAWYHTYSLPIIISNCSNNYGPFQFPEKFIPLIIYNIINKKELPIYGDGQNIRDWIHVYDHADALDLIFHKGLIGETYLVGANDQRKNIEIVNIITDFADLLLQRENGSSKDLIRFVEDRPGHDKRYAIDTEKIYSQLGWKPKINLKNGIKKTIEWYIENKKWIDYSLKKNI